MPHHIEMNKPAIQPAEFNVTNTIENVILPRGHVIRGLPNGNYSRTIGIHDSHPETKDARLLGWGVDGSVERALVRAVLTYALREEDGLEFIDSMTYPESTMRGKRPTLPGSALDRIALGEFKLFRNDTDVVAWSGYAETGYVKTPIEAIAPDARTAIEALAAIWKRNGRRIDAPTIATIPPQTF